MPSMLSTSPSIEATLAFIASSDDTTAGLRALAQEVGGRQGRRYQSLADRIERGEVHPSLELNGPVPAESTSLGDVTNPSIVTSSDARRPSPVACLTRFAMLERSRSTARHQLIVVSVLGWFYLVSSLAIGWFILQTALPFVTGLLQDLDSEEAIASRIASIQFFTGLYAVAIALLIVAAGLFFVRLTSRSPAWIEWLWDHVPMIGSTLRAKELAEMAESFYQSLLRGQDYSAAFGIASHSTTSTRLRRWLIASKRRVETGASLATIASSLPGRAEFISGIMPALVSAPSAAVVVDLWRETSVRMHGLMRQRGERLRTVLAPILVVASLLIASFALILTLGTLYQINELISKNFYYYYYY